MGMKVITGQKVGTSNIVHNGYFWPGLVQATGQNTVSTKGGKWQPRGRGSMQYLDTGLYPVWAPGELVIVWRGKLLPWLWVQVSERR